jgi:hypothetical protein
MSVENEKSKVSVRTTAAWRWGAGRVSCRKDLDTKGKAMVITLDPELEAALNEAARRQGIAPEVLAVNALRQRFLVAAGLQPRDEWERGLLEVARDCRVSLPDSALSSDGLYE